MERIVHDNRKGTCKMNNIKTLVFAEVQDRLEQMNGKQPTEDEYKAAADVTLKLIDRVTKMEEVDLQAQAAELKKRELELQAEANKLKEKELEEARQLKEQELKEAHKSGVRDTITQVVKIVVPSVICVVAAVGLTVYERTEVVTGTAGREIWKRVFRLI